MRRKNAGGGSNIVTLAAVGIGGYFLYEWLTTPTAAAATPAASTPAAGTSTATPTAGATVAGSTLVASSTTPTASTPAASSAPAVTLASLYQSLLALAGADSQFTGTGDALTGTGYQWGFYLQRILQPGSVVDLPAGLYLDTVFPGIDMSQPMTAAAFWAAMGPAIGKLYGLSGFRALRGIYGLGDLPACSDMSVDAGFVGPVDCVGSQSDISYPASQSQLANLVQSLGTSSAPTTATTAGVSTTTLLLGGAAVLGLALVLGGRR